LAEIQNPNLQMQGPGKGSGGGGGDMRVMIAVMLVVFVIFFGYDYFKAKTNPTQPTPAAQSQSQALPPAALQAPAQTAPAQAASSATPGAAQAPVDATAVVAAAETETTVENDQYKIVFTNRGAQVKHWILKKHSDSANKPLDLVQPQIAAQFGYPISLFTYEPALNETLNKKALYQVTATGAQPTATGHVLVPATSALTFHYAANGLDVIKTIRFDQSYVVSIESQVLRNGSPVRALVAWPAALGDMEEFLPKRIDNSTGYQVRASDNSLFAWSLNGKQDTMKASKVSNNATLDQPYDYAAIADLYFAAAFLPDVPARATTVTLHNSVDILTDTSDPTSQKKAASVIGLAMGDQSGITRLRLFVGPKETDVLKAVHATGEDGKPSKEDLESLLQFGSMLGYIAKPLYLALRFLHGLMGTGAYNWGWAIIIVTVIFNLLMLPTRFMMMKSSLKMMRIQPKVDAIKRKYANLKATDPKRAEMNTEMMSLYKTEGVNMYGSCLPMLVQMPLFFAYYRVLLNAVELRQAHWFWLTDLSVPDPLHILPIIIIVSMFAVQMMTPAAGMDPAQRRMMAFMMPAVFGFSMWHFASGLALYWGTGNVINLAMQYGINQSKMGKEMHAIAAKRAVKKAGAGPKTIQGRK
jgi:YidC/Oxa1 family membrane protein insertase